MTRRRRCLYIMNLISWNDMCIFCMNGFGVMEGDRRVYVLYMFMVWKKLTRIEDDDDEEDDDEMAYLFQAWGNWQRLVGVVVCWLGVEKREICVGKKYAAMSREETGDFCNGAGLSLKKR